MALDKRGDEFECPHCTATGYLALLWSCSGKADAEFKRLAVADTPPSVVIPVALRGLVDEVDWLSLRRQDE